MKEEQNIHPVNSKIGTKVACYMMIFISYDGRAARVMKRNWIWCQSIYVTSKRILA